MIGIYKFTNKENGKVYIGKSVNINSRKNRHYYNARHGMNGSFYNALRKYGESCFSFDVLRDLSYLEGEDNNTVNKELDYWERHYINAYKANIKEYGYNNTEGGDGVLGYRHTSETKNSISNNLKGKKKAQEFSEKMKNRKGEKRSNETCQHMSDAKSGKIWITNDKDEYQIYPTEIDKYPDYHLGRRPGRKNKKEITYKDPEKHTENCSKAQLGKRWMSNGIKHTQVMKYDIPIKLEEGWFFCKMNGEPIPM